jgi:endonuclease YncB( thermonuclease family)
VIDGGTLRIGGERLGVAGLATARIQGAACRAEREQGIAAAIALSERLKSGEVTIGAPDRDPQGRVVRTVKVDGTDVAAGMIKAGHGRFDDGTKQKWCSN